MSGVDDLGTWLRAQLDDDERVARRVAPNQAPIDLRAMVTREGSEPFLIVDSARVLAEVDAKRRILDDCAGYYEDGAESAEAVTDGMAWRTLVALALPYADRPGYRDEWRP
jgi:hypothetical protein